MPKHKRGSGVLLHITSLPSLYGIGDLGKGAYDFCEFLSDTKQSYWQVLPLNPTSSVFGNSPYSSISGTAGNPMLISPDLLMKEGYISKNFLIDIPQFPKNKVDYKSCYDLKTKILNQAFEESCNELKNDPQFNFFCSENKEWLDDYSFYISLKAHFGDISWEAFPKEIRDRKEPYCRDLKYQLSYAILKEKFFQYLFYKQWNSLKNFCNEKKVKIIGDLPFYVNHDSQDVWANRSFFKLDNDGNPLFVSGVPPDYFSETGQRWGNPVYDWNTLKENGYKWWIERIKHNLNLFDILRLDHFRGFVSYWEIPSDEQNAVNGKWVEVPGEDFFCRVLRIFEPGDFIAEDLGDITQDVIELRDKLNFPGMNILQFAFGEDFPNGSFLPENNNENSIIYTGTHDNNTTLGWWEEESTDEQRNRVLDYIENKNELEIPNINWKFIELALSSKAKIAIVPFQDILGLGDEAKMNRPSSGKGNWEWRIENLSAADSFKKQLSLISCKYSRF